MAAPRITLRAQMTLLLKPRALERGGAETPNEGVGYIDHLDVSEVGQPDGEFSQPPNWEEELMFFSNLLDTPGASTLLPAPPTFHTLPIPLTTRGLRADHVRRFV